MKTRFLLLIAPLAIAGCQLVPAKGKSSSIVPSDSSATISPQSSEDSSSEVDNSSSSKSSSSSSSSSSASTSTSSTTYIPTTTESEDDYLDGRTILPCGYVQLDKPTNTPIEIETTYESNVWYEEEMLSSLSDDWTFIYGNSTSKAASPHHANPSFYASDKGGLKMDQKSKGIQSPMFTHSGEKLEIRIYISAVENAGVLKDKSDDMSFLYFYDKDGEFLPEQTKTFHQGDITANTEGNFIRKYVTDAKDIAYFEFRLNVQPYKSSQKYNFGIGKVSVHSWPKA